MWPGTYGMTTLYVNGWEYDSSGSYARHSYHLYINDDSTKIYNLSFSIEASTQDAKHRGPFTNDRDYEWKLSGSIDNWSLEQLS
jgi:hypothetical protein